MRERGRRTDIRTDTGPQQRPRLRIASRDKKSGRDSLILDNERRVAELIPVLGSQPAGNRSDKPGGRLPLLYAWSAVTFPAGEHHWHRTVRLVNRGTSVNDLPGVTARQRGD